MMRNLTYIILITTLFLACQNVGKSTADIPSTFTTEKIIANATNLEELITKTDIAKITGVNVEDITIVNKNYEQNVAINMLLFSWQNGEKEVVKSKDGNFEIKGSSSIGLGKMVKISKSEFEQNYRTRSKEEINNQINSLVNDTSLNADIAIWEAKELAKQAKNQNFEKVDNVGTLAYWETPFNVLHVLVNDVAFSITTNFSEDPNSSKLKAIALVDLIIKKSVN